MDMKRGHRPKSKPLLDFAEESPVELVDGVDVGEEQVGQALGHSVLLHHGTAEPLWSTGSIETSPFRHTDLNLEQRTADTGGHSPL